MGARGQLTKPNSRRGLRIVGKTDKILTHDPRMPKWTPAHLRAEFRRVVADLKEANVPTQAVDGEAIAHYVIATDEVKKAIEAGDSKLAARLGRDVIHWSNLLGANPAGRARLGIVREERRTVDPIDEAMFA